MNLHGRSFLTLKDFTPEEIGYLLDLAAELKAKKKQGIYGTSLAHKNIALIFEKPSTRTRCAFTVGAQDEGGNAALETIFSRKSVRSYTDQAVSDAQVETLLRAAMAAPTGMNLQPWRFVVRSGTASPMISIRRRSWRISSRCASIWAGSRVRSLSLSATAATTWRTPSWSAAERWA